MTLSLHETRDFDVVVIGAGPGGLAAAARAAELGAKVALVEVLDSLGGNASYSTGYLVFVDTDFQKTNGVTDTLSDFMADCEKQYALEKDNGGLIWDEVLTRDYGAQSRAAYDYLAGLGVRFDRLLSKPSQHRNHRLHAMSEPAEIGTLFQKRLADLGVTLFLNHRASRLLREGDKVSGVRIEAVGASNQAQIELRAAKGVVIATGGYQAGYHIRKRFQPERDINGYLNGVPTARGDGHVMGYSVGADMINMAYLQPMILIPSLLAEDAIAVNRAGRRFHDETGKYADRVAALEAEPDRYGYYIIDATTLKDKADVIGLMPEAPIMANGLSELAMKIGCDASGLEKTVQEWNAFLATDQIKEAETGRTIFPQGRRPIGAGPYAAMKMIRSTTFTWGGMVISREMEVMNIYGEAIEGLYAVGDVTGGINVISGMGGVHISSALVQGFQAGAAVVKGVKAPAHLAPMAQDTNFVTKSAIKMVLFDLDEKQKASA